MARGTFAACQAANVPTTSRLTVRGTFAAALADCGHPNPPLPGWPDGAVGEIAKRQLGLVTRLQLRELGVTRAAIDHALRRGRLRSVHRGVYAVGHIAFPPLAAELAAVLAVGERALLSHHSALALWGLALGRAPDRDPEVDVTIVGRDAGRRRPGIRVHRVPELDLRDVTTRHGIPTTSAARTLLDVAPDLDSRALERAFDEGLTRRLLTRHAVASLLARTARRPGMRPLDLLARAELRTPTVTRSDMEERFLKLVRSAQLSPPEVNAAVGRYRVDFLWRSPGLVVELDGYEFHSTRRSFEADHRRDLELGAAGLAVMRFTWRQLFDQPELVLVQLAQRLAVLSGYGTERLNRTVGGSASGFDV